MTQPKRFPPDDPREWLGRARSNLTYAQTEVAGVYLEDRCFEAQQAAEKAIKAVLIHRDIEFPFIHNLLTLLKLLEDSGEYIPPTVQQAEDLTPFAVLTRYPGADPVSQSEYEDAVTIAETVLTWAIDIVRQTYPDYT
jgi:HEPN domain-containing protein